MFHQVFQWYLSFTSIQKKHDVYRDKDCMKMFCESLREHAMNIINLKKKHKVINKWTAGIIWKCKKSVILLKKNSKVNKIKIKI